jgi:hypothetical protein
LPDPAKVRVIFTIAGKDGALRPFRPVSSACLDDFLNGYYRFFVALGVTVIRPPEVGGQLV